MSLLFCASTQAQQFSETIMIGSESRNFIYYEPAIYGTAGETVPVMFIFHGLGGTATNMATAGFNLIADTANMIPVYMQGTLNSQSQTAWNNGTLLSSTTDDLAFVAQVLDSMQARYNIDPTRIYAGGFSMGGIMTHHLACANEEFSAITSISGTMATSDIAGCGRTLPLRVLHMHGTADGTVPYDGTALPSLSLVQQTLDFYKGYTGCSDSTICRIPDTANDGIVIDVIEYGSCTGVQELVHWKLIGGDHIWPTPPTNDIWAGKVIWNFLEQQDHGYNCTSTLSIEEEQVNFELSIFPNPSEGKITITTDEEVTGIEIVDLNGKVLRSRTGLKLNTITEDISDLNSGVYFIKVKTKKGNQIKKIILK